jgi:hypothetical protein
MRYLDAFEPLSINIDRWQYPCSGTTRIEVAFTRSLTCPHFVGIAQQKLVVDDERMNSKIRRPRLGDQVGIAGFLGRFEVIQIGLNGAIIDLKHLGSCGPDYIERDILSHELIYLNAEKLDTSANLTGERVLFGEPVTR